MRILSVQVGKPRSVEHRGRTVRTAITKDPVLFRVRVGRLGLDGDAQADLRVHGGPDKAVYAYDLSGYAHWRDALGADLPHGQFGENLTVEGMPETEVRLDDVYRAGTALLQVVSPRSPCFKLAVKMERPRFPKAFLQSRRTGFYLRVLEEGELGAGDAITLVSRNAAAPTVDQAVRDAYGL
jgi:MOSC domain-containing protein YiiM